VFTDCFAVDLLNKVGPCVADIRDIPIVGGMVDEKAYIVVAGLIGVIMIQLGAVSRWLPPDW
jgi:hypothetical protein